jgi:hypothetical protein
MNPLFRRMVDDDDGDGLEEVDEELENGFREAVEPEEAGEEGESRMRGMIKSHPGTPS